MRETGSSTAVAVEDATPSREHWAVRLYEA